MEASSFLALVLNEITRYIFLHTFIIFLHELYVNMNYILAVIFIILEVLFFNFCRMVILSEMKFSCVDFLSEI